jgi:hypothetical protein
LTPEIFVKASQRLLRQYYAQFVLALVVGAAIPVAGFGQTPDPLGVADKFYFHAEGAYGPWQVLGAAAYAGILHEMDAPTEWGQGAAGYGKRFASTVACSGIHGAIAFGLDTALHEDPRYFRSKDRGFWRRSAHVIRGTLLTHTDSGAETVSAWRIGADYGAAYLSNQWYPGRLNTARLGFIQGSLTLGFDLVSNVGTEFWPDIKKKVLHKK